MKEAMQSLACLCMTAALCTQLMHSRRNRFSVRLVLGLEIFRVMLTLVCSGIPR